MTPATHADVLRCPAAHVEDRSRCAGAVDAARIVDRTGAEVYGCVWHAAVLLASLEGGRVYPGVVPGAALDVYDTAQRLAPFAWTR